MSEQIHKAIVSVMRQIGAIGKNSRNDFQNFDFRGIDAVMNAMHPLLLKHGVYPAPQCLSQEIHPVVVKNKPASHALLSMRYVFTAEDGSHVDVVVPGEAIDYGDKACNKAMAVAYKYAMCQLFCIPTDLPDPDAQCYDSPTPAPPALAPRGCDAEKAALFGWMKGCITAAGVTEIEAGPIALAIVKAEVGLPVTEQAQLDQVQQAVETGCYDLTTGERATQEKS